MTSSGHAAQLQHVTLPNETLSYILEELSPSSLATVSRVSQHFNAVAERLLYSSISLRDILSESCPVPTRTIRCCLSILQRPCWIESIKGLTIRWSVDTISPPSHYHLVPALAQVSAALQRLSFLENLDIHLGPANSVGSPDGLHAVERIIHGCQLPHLHTCSLSADWSKGVWQTYSGILVAFLTHSPAMRVLKLTDHRSSIYLPTFALPHLSSFRGSTDAAASLLPGRPIQMLSLVGQDSDITRENLSCIAQTSLPIRHLDLSAISIRPIVLKNISEFLPSIHVLRLRLTLRHTLHYALSGIRLLTGLSQVLSSFPDLTHLDLSPCSGAPPVQPNASEELALCREWRRACSHLRIIIFPSQMRWSLVDSDSWSPVT